jgi:hypothetical protein
MRHYPSPHRIKFDITAARDQISIATHRGTLEPTLPQGAGAPIGFVDVTNKSSSHALHESTEVPNLRRFDQKMNMISHQDVRVNPAMAFHLGLSKAFQKETVIVITEKCRGAIVSALDDVMRISGNGDSRQSGHGASRSLSI